MESRNSLFHWQEYTGVMNEADAFHGRTKFTGHLTPSFPSKTFRNPVKSSFCPSIILSYLSLVCHLPSTRHGRGYMTLGFYCSHMPRERGEREIERSDFRGRVSRCEYRLRTALLMDVLVGFQGVSGEDYLVYAWKFSERSVFRVKKRLAVSSRQPFLSHSLPVSSPPPAYPTLRLLDLYDQLLHLPVFITPIRQVPPDHKRQFPFQQFLLRYMHGVRVIRIHLH